MYGEHTEANDLIGFWRRFTPDVPPFFHPEDWPFLQRRNGRYIDGEAKGFDEFLRSPGFGDANDHRLHLSLMPVPYGGNLDRADIVVLLLNPGVVLSDYYGETRVPMFRKRLESNLAQDFSGTDFPFLWLDPEFCWHGGFGWWEGKLREVISVIARERFGGRYLDALRDLSQRLAHVELVPYHSPSFRAHPLVSELPSVRRALGFVRSTLLPAKDKTVIVTRKAREWALADTSTGCDLVVYESGQARRASLGPETPGGRAILRRYGIAPETTASTPTDP